MPYTIEKKPFDGQVITGTDWIRGRGRPPRYPIAQLAIGEWLRIPRAEELWLWHAARYANRKASGMKVQVQLEASGAHWIVTRVK